MARYSATVRDQNQAPIPGVSITVTLRSGAVPVLTDDDGDALEQPLKTDEYGGFYFNAADDFYDLSYYFGGRLIRRDYGVDVGTPLTLREAVDEAKMWAEASAAAGISNGVLAGGPCATAGTTNITLSGIQNVSGVSGAVNMRVLLTNQTNAAENGPWLMKSGAWVRPTDFDQTGEALQGAYVLVDGGAARGGYILVTQNPIILGTTPLQWVLVASYTNGEVNFGTGGVFDIPTTDVNGNWSRTMFIQPAPATGTQTNSAGGDDECSVSLNIASGRVTNGPTGQETYWNTVMNFGINQTSSFTPLQPDLPSASYRIESKFAQGAPTDPFIVEFHQSMFPASDPANEYRLWSGTIPHLVSDWNGPGASLSTRFNTWGWLSGVGDVRVQVLLGGMGNSINFKDSGAGKRHPQLFFDTNNRATAFQKDVAGSAYLPLPYRNSNDNHHLGGGALYLVTGTQATPLGVTCAFALNVTSASANQSAMNISCGSVTGDFNSIDVSGAISGKMTHNLYNNAGTVLVNLAVLNGAGSDAIIGFTNDGGGGSFSLGYDNTGDTLRCEGSYRSVGNDSNLYWECQPTAGVTYFAKPPKLPSRAKAALPAAATVGAGAMAFCTDESGGAVPVFSDGTDWRRVTDRAVVS